jgi:regulator of protease activity HflC (stomatin/prohibitin superfamily)
MRQAADILASPAAMQIRQLEALQAMAKTASSKVVFVPMQLQSDVVGAMAQQQSSGSFSGDAIAPSARAALLSSMSDV